MADMQEMVRLTNIFYFRQKVYEKTDWLGIKTAKCPMDMWVYQEIITNLKTDLLIETGTLFGGSALFFANLFDALGRGTVISIDIESQPNLPKHPRIKYIQGSSTDAKVLKKVRNYAEKAKSVSVILDSDHRADHKLDELRKYSEFVTSNNYIIAEDTCFDYFPAWPEYGKGPTAAVVDFLKENSQFEVDRSQEKHMITFSPMAFLKKKS